MNAITPTATVTAGATPLRFSLKRFAEITLPRDGAYLIKDIIPRTGLIVCYGPPKEGKTFMVMDMALHIAAGRPYRGQRTKQGPVIYICCEGKRGFLTRLVAFRQHYPAFKEMPPDFHILTANLSLPGDLKQLISDIRLQGIRPALIVVDTLNRTIEGSESTDTDMGKYIRALEELGAPFDCAVLVVHHCGHNAQGRPRGHSSLMAACDTQIAVARDSKDRVVALQVQLMKDGKEDTEIISQLQVVELGKDEDGEPIKSCVVVPFDLLTARRGGTGKSNRLPPAATVALKALKEVIAAEGENPPSDAGIPEGVTRVVQVAKWRERACELGISKGNNDAKQMAFRRALKALREAGLAMAEHPYAWLMTPQTG